MGVVGSDLVRRVTVLGARPAGRQSAEAVPGQADTTLFGPELQAPVPGRRLTCPLLAAFWLPGDR